MTDDLQRRLVAELGLHSLHRGGDRAHGQEHEAARAIPEYVVIVEVDGRPIGFGIALPNLNELITDFKGRLLPFNWLKLLWRLKRGARTARVPLMGIRRSFNGGLIGGLAPLLIIDAIRKALRDKGVQQVEMSWILEDNRPMRHMIEPLGGVAYKTYRVYEKRLGPVTP